MTIGRKVGEFSMKSTGVLVYATAGGGGENHINFEGTGTGYGTVIGTLSLSADGPGAKTGRAQWAGGGYLDNGETVQGSGDGYFEECGKHRWRVRSIMRVSDGTVLLTDGVISLEGRSYEGTLHEFS